MAGNYRGSWSSGMLSMLSRRVCVNALRLSIYATSPSSEGCLWDVQTLITPRRVELEVASCDFDDQLLQITRETARGLQRLVLKRDNRHLEYQPDACRTVPTLGRILHRIAQTDIRALSVEWSANWHEDHKWAIDRYLAFSLSPKHSIAELCLSLGGCSLVTHDVKDQFDLVVRLGGHASLETLILCDVAPSNLGPVAEMAIVNCRQVRQLSVSSNEPVTIDAKTLILACSTAYVGGTALASLLFYPPQKAVPAWGYKWDNIAAGRATMEWFGAPLSPGQFRSVVHLMRKRNLVLNYLHLKIRDGLWSGAIVPRNIPSAEWEKLPDQDEDVRYGEHHTLEQENSAVVRFRVLWANATVVTAFKRANSHHRYESSILALMPSIMGCLATTDEWKENRAAQNSAFMGSRFAANTCLIATAVAPPPVVVTIASGRKRKGVN